MKGKRKEGSEKEGWKRRDRRKTEVGAGKERVSGREREMKASKGKARQGENERRRRKGRASVEWRRGAGEKYIILF